MHYRPAMLVAFVICALTAQDTWTVGPRAIPVPAGASDELRTAIANSPQPDLAQARQFSPTTDAEWLPMIEGGERGAAVSTRAMAESWNVELTERQIGGVTVYDVVPAEIAEANENRLFVHVHGGAYVFGGGLGAASEAIIVAHRAKIRALSIDYRMPPEHPFPAAVDDVATVWRNLIEDREPASMALGGTSTGGGLTLAAPLKFKELGLPLPGALWAGTPWSDLTKTGDSRFINEGIDRILVSQDGLLEAAAKLYAADHDLKDPLISPVYGDFTGFPPTQLVTGTRDLFLSDTARAHRAMRNAGVIADLNVYEGVAHADYASVLDSPESEQVFAELGAFLLRHLR